MSPAQLKVARQIGRRIQQLITEAGFTSLTQFSEAANKQGQAHIWPGDVAKIVSGERSPTVKVLLRLAGVLGEDVFQLLVVPSLSPKHELVDRMRRAHSQTVGRLRRELDEDLDGAR